MKGKIVYKNGTVQFPMFILVSMLFGLVTGELEGVLWGTFHFGLDSPNLCVYNVHCVHQIKIKKSKKSAHVDLPFFIRKVGMTGGLAISGLK